MKDKSPLIHVFQALAVETRLQIIRLLKGRALCVGALAARLNVTQGAVSQHLRILREAGVVVAEKRGYYTHYKLNDKTLARWKSEIGALLS